MHVDGEGGNESQAQVVAQRPGVGVGAKVPAHQRAVDGGVRQHRLGARVKVVDVDRTAVLLQVQRPERETDRVRLVLISTEVSPVGMLEYVTWSGRAELSGILEVCLLRPPAAGWSRYLRPPPSNVSPDRRSASSRGRRYESTSTQTCRTQQRR